MAEDEQDEYHEQEYGEERCTSDEAGVDAASGGVVVTTWDHMRTRARPVTAGPVVIVGVAIGAACAVGQAKLI